MARLYLLRHAPAVPRGTPGYAGDDRPLTREGVRKLKRAAKGLRRVMGKVDRVVASPLVRAKDTATVAADAVGFRGKVEVSRTLLPDGDPVPLLPRLRESHLLVGHEPALSRFASALLGAPAGILALKKGGVCRIDLVRGKARLAWSLTPRQLRRMS